MAESINSKDNEVRNILFCVAKCKEQVGRGLVIEILQGSHSVRLFSRRLNQNSAFGSMKGYSAEDLDGMIQELVDEGLLEETTDEFARLMMTEQGHERLKEYAE